MKKIDFNDKDHTLLVNLPGDVMGRHAHNARSMGFHPKEEFHITILGYKAGKIIREQLNDHCEILETRYIDAVNEFMCSVHDYLDTFYISEDCEMRIIEKKYDDEYRKSLIYVLDPDQSHLRFHYKMEALFHGIETHLPIPHVTIGVDGEHPGIGFTPYVRNNELTNNFLVSYPR